MGTKIVMPKKEIRNKRLFVPITPSEQKRIRKICKEQKISISDLIRYSLKQTIDF
jgi:hypothetical protein